MKYFSSIDEMQEWMKESEGPVLDGPSPSPLMYQIRKSKAISSDVVRFRFLQNGTLNNYCVTITLDPTLISDKKHFYSQYLESASIIQKYLDRRKCEYYLVPELTQAGNIHYHGLIKVSKVIANDAQREYRDPHGRDIPLEHTLKVMSNYLRRKIGFSKWEKITSFYDEYRRPRYGRMTSYMSIYHYLHKDVKGDYPICRCPILVSQCLKDDSAYAIDD